MLTGVLSGAVLIVYPRIASNTYAATRVVVAGSAPGDSDGDDGDEDLRSDSDSKSAAGDAAGDVDEVDGDPQEIISRSVTHLSHWAKQAALAADCFLIDDMLGRHNAAKYFPRPVTFAHVERTEQAKGKRIETALLLIPRPDYTNQLAAGSAPSSEAGSTIFEKSILVRDGVYADVEETEEYIDVTRNNALHARKTQSGHWQTSGLKLPGRGYVANKAARGQLGYKTYMCMLKDLIKGIAPGSTLLINDFLGASESLAWQQCMLEPARRLRTRASRLPIGVSSQRAHFWRLRRRTSTPRSGNCF